MLGFVIVAIVLSVVVSGLIASAVVGDGDKQPSFAIFFFSIFIVAAITFVCGMEGGTQDGYQRAINDVATGQVEIVADTTSTVTFTVEPVE